MKRKRFIKLCMGTLGLTRNEANAVAAIVREGWFHARIKPAVSQEQLLISFKVDAEEVPSLDNMAKE